MPRPILATLLATTLFLPACLFRGRTQPETPTVKPAAQGIFARSRELNQTLLIVDTHVDTPHHSLEQGEEWSLANSQVGRGHNDLPRMQKSGLDAPFMVVYTPYELEPEPAMQHALGLIDRIHSWAETWPNHLTIARSPAEVRAAKAGGRIGMVLCMENGSPILPGRLDLLRLYARSGVSYLGLAHWHTNHLCDAATDEPEHGGVSPFGEEVIAECNRLGTMLDVSHVSDDAVRDYLRLSKAPIIASHSNARAVCGHVRNLPDDLLRAIAQAGGVIQLNLAAGYVSEGYRLKAEELRPARTKFYEELKIKHGEDREAIDQAMAEYRQREPKIPLPPLDEWFEHVDYMVELVGKDHLGLGSDFDGVSALPKEITGVEHLHRLTVGFLERGWSEEDLAKFYGGNILRTWEQVRRVAEDLR